MSEPSSECATMLAELPSLAEADRVARVRDAGVPDEVLGRLAAEAEQLAVTDAGQALEVTACLVAVSDGIGSALGRSLVLRARGSALCHAGRLEEGWLFCDQAAQLAEKAGRPIESGLARLRSMQALGELGRFDESVNAGEAARAAFQQAGEEQLKARAEVNLGVIFHRRDDPARALEYFDRARPRLGDAPMALGTVDNNRGEALLALNDFKGARTAFRSALDQCERAEADLSAAVVEGNLADLASRQGQLHRAVYHFERARRRLETTGSSGHLSRLLTEQAEAVSVLGLPADALKLYEQALPALDRAGQALEAARARAGLGRTLVRLGCLSDAETALAAAARAFDELDHGSARARVDLVRAELCAANGRAGEARRLIHSALAVLHDRPIEAAAARHLLGRLAMAENTLDQAEAELTAALSLARQLDLAPLLADVLHTLGCLRRRQGDLPSAVGNLQSATTQIERVRGALNAQRFRGAYLSDRLGVYDDLITALLEQAGDQDVNRAFAVAEQSKSRLLLEQVSGEIDMAEDTTVPMDPSERRLAQEHAELRGRLNAMYSRLGDDDRAGVPKVWQKSVIELERRLEDLESRLTTTRGTVGLYARSVDASRAAAALDPGTTLLEYVFAGEEVLAFIVGQGRTAVGRHLASTGVLKDALARLQFQINRALRAGAHAGWRGERLLADVRAELAALDRLLLEPLRPLIERGTRLLIVPHGALHLLPFHALWDGERHLIETHEVHYCPSASLYAQLATRRPAGRRAVVVGIADSAAPRIESEARRVAEMFGAASDDVLIGEAATAEHLGQRSRGAGLLHLACHARFASGTPLGSGLRLADRWLTVRDIYAMRLEAELVTLSGCETGRSQVRNGDELVGLLRGFFAAGASSLLLSLWRVEDESAAHMMADFYSLWPHDEASKAAALREAQLAGLARSPHPAFWAPFRLIGRP